MTTAVRSAMRSWWNEPRAADPPPVGVSDLVLVGAGLVLALAESLLRPDLQLRPLAFLLGAIPIVALLWRRSHPLAAVVVGFGVHGITAFTPLFGHQHDATSLYATILALILPYSLLRWGSGREAVIGLVYILAAHVWMVADQPDGVGTSLAGLAVLELPAALGAAVRYRDHSRRRDLDQVRAHERELLARELHDVVAHHVSAIAVQAQAGQAVAATDPAAAAGVLAAIEGEATRALAEMRSMVGALRGDDEGPALAPQRGVADLGLLAEGPPGGPVVEVVGTGALDDLPPSVDAAVYRLAQESVTNARRHARRATTIRVAVAGEPDGVHLTVSDDGEPGGADGRAGGYGLVGMKERVHLLGGTFRAGPAPGRGWTVAAVLPRTGEGA